MQRDQALEVVGEFGAVRGATLSALWPRPASYFARNNWAGRLLIDGRAVLIGNSALLRSRSVDLGALPERAAALGPPDTSANTLLSIACQLSTPGLYGLGAPFVRNSDMGFGMSVVRALQEKAQRSQPLLLDSIMKKFMANT